MALPVDWSTLTGYRSGNADLATIEASCPTGCEKALLSEVLSTFGAGTAAVPHQGRVFFDVPLDLVPAVLRLRVVDNAWVLALVRPTCAEELRGRDDPERALSFLVSLVSLGFDWKKSLSAWNRVARFFPSDEGVAKALEGGDAAESLSFRATCYRSGHNCHAFTSMDAAKAVGGAVHDRFGWKVRMKEADVDVTFNVDIDQVYCGIKLTKESLFCRNVTSFGPTTLRATICAALIRYAEVEPGDIVVDPMCGGGSIPIEGCTSGQPAFFFGGEIHEKGVRRCTENLASLSSGASSVATGFVRWDVTRVPLRDSCADVFVADLPFGKRSGSKADNRVLYPKVLNSMARVVRPNTGRAVVLTQDKTSMFKAQPKYSRYWKTKGYHACNVGGLAALIFVLSRTAALPGQ